MRVSREAVQEDFIYGQHVEEGCGYSRVCHDRVKLRIARVWLHLYLVTLIMCK